MNLFGCKFCTDIYSEHNTYDNQNVTRSCERKNFDTLLWATITVFQVMF